MSYREASLRERRGPSASVLGKPRPRHWQTVSQLLGGRFPALGNSSPSIGVPCPSARKPSPSAWERFPNSCTCELFPNTWETFSQYLGNGCPILGQGLPNAWETVAQYFVNGCTMLGQPLPNIWATVVQCLGKCFPIFGQWLPNAPQHVNKMPLTSVPN